MPATSAAMTKNVASGRPVVVVRVFIKKTQKTPPRELELARQRAKDVT